MKKFFKIFLILSFPFGIFFVWLNTSLNFNEPQKWVFYDKNEEILFTEKPFFQMSEKTDFEKIKKVLLSIEDRRFYSHLGVDFRAIFRAFLSNINSQKITSGASTITMQLARILFLKNEKHDFRYKIKQIFYAWKLEYLFSKDEILQMYLDRVYLGKGAYGFSEAANRYFSKRTNLLTIDEIATLVGTLPRPDNWNLITDFEQSEKRKLIVLSQLKKRGIIDNSEFEFYTQEKTKINPFDLNKIHAPHFVLWAKKQLKNRIPNNIPLVQVYTTIDKSKYQESLRIVRENIKKRKVTKNLSNASVISLEIPSNELRVMLGSVDFFEKKIDGFVNMATAKRELGSTLKPFLFALAIKNGFSPADELRDERDSYLTNEGSYSPRNFDPNHEYGRVRFREALANSYNIAAVNLLEKIGLQSFHEFLKKLGLSLHQDSEEVGFSLILGSGESSLLALTKAYSIFPQKGELKSVKFFTKVLDHKGYKILNWEDLSQRSETILKKSTAEWVTHVLSDKAIRWQNFSRGNPLELEFETASKTGTSQDFRDNFVVGFSPHFLTGVWVGNADGKPMYTSSGIEGAGPIWNGIMRILNTKRSKKFSFFSDREEIQICRLPWQSFPDCTETITEFLLPAELEKLSKQKNNVSSPKIEISFPGNGDRFHANSSISIKVRNVFDVKKVKYFLDGIQSESIISKVSVGKHILSVEYEGERESIEIFVES